HERSATRPPAQDPAGAVRAQPHAHRGATQARAADGRRDRREAGPAAAADLEAPEGPRRARGRYGARGGEQADLRPQAGTVPRPRGLAGAAPPHARGDVREPRRLPATGTAREEPSRRRGRGLTPRRRRTWRKAR